MRCGCKFSLTENGKEIVPVYVEELPLDCPLTWDFICEGNTKGIFQLESQLGRSTAKKTKPRSISELADLISILRPGSGDAIVDGKTLTQHYIDRKNGKDSVAYPHPILEPILKETYGVIVYQEQAMKIAQLVAGFNLQQADNLRKAIGKKKADLMKKVETEFIESAKAIGKLSEKDIIYIFSIVKKAQRYSFNKSHAVAYALIGYIQAYQKAHFTRENMTALLKHAHGKIDPMQEISELVDNAKQMGIEVQPPCIFNLNKEFKFINNLPTFGLTNIKGVGDSVYENIINYIEKKFINIKELNWEQFLIHFVKVIKSNSFREMIRAGLFDKYNVSRNKILYTYNIIKSIYDKDKNYIEFMCAHKCISIKEGIIKIIEFIKQTKKTTTHVQKRLAFLDGCIVGIDNPSHSLEDDILWKNTQEQELLGASLTINPVDAYDCSQATCTCAGFKRSLEIKFPAIAAQIMEVKEHKIGSGKNKGKVMGFLKLSDSSGSLDNVTVFSEEWKSFGNQLDKNAVLLFMGLRSNNDNSGFIIKNIKKIQKIKD